MQTDNMFPLPQNEAERLEVLTGYDILDTLPEKDFDAITRLASYICGVPIALVSLLDENRQWFKSQVGLPVPETARNISFCQYAILNNEIFEVPDTQKDDRFIANSLVTAAPNIRFYAGAPLVMPEGVAVGTLCVIDRIPKMLTNEQREALQTLANEVVSHIVLRKQKRILEQENSIWRKLCR
jgi:GAF domain-containing protein